MQFVAPEASEREDVVVTRCDRATVDQEVTNQLPLDAALARVKHLLTAEVTELNRVTEFVNSEDEVKLFKSSLTLRKVTQLNRLTSTSSHRLNTCSQNVRTTPS